MNMIRTDRAGEYLCSFFSTDTAQEIAGTGADLTGEYFVSVFGDPNDMQLYAEYGV